MLNRMTSAKRLSEINLLSAYHQICIGLRNKWRSAFITQDILYEQTVEYFGSSTAPRTFTKVMTLFWPFTDKDFILTIHWQVFSGLSQWAHTFQSLYIKNTWAIFAVSLKHIRRQSYMLISSEHLSRVLFLGSIICTWEMIASPNRVKEWHNKQTFPKSRALMVWQHFTMIQREVQFCYTRVPITKCSQKGGVQADSNCINSL